MLSITPGQLAGEDGGHHQHDCQVDSNGIAKQVFVKEDGDVAYKEQEDGGEVFAAPSYTEIDNWMQQTGKSLPILYHLPVV